MSLSGFEILNRLGSGSFGTVFKVRRYADSLIYVIKSVRIAELSGREQLEAINEVTILSKMNSPFVVRYYDSFIDQDCLHIVMEYCNRGDLQTLLKKAKEKNMSSLKENVTWNIFLQIVLGLHYLHNQKILHRDLKTANVFLMKDDSQPFFLVKIGDLGVAKLLETSTAFAKTIVGTPYYLSPELCADQPYRDKSDCWALGVLLYECLTLRHPFEARNQCALIMKIIQAQFAAPSSASLEMTNLVSWLLQKDPTHRPSIKDLLNEEFIRKKLSENSFDVPNQLVESAVVSLLESQTVDFTAAATMSALQPNSPSSNALAATRVPGSKDSDLVFPSLQGTSSRYASNNSNNNGSSSNNGGSSISNNQTIKQGIQQSNMQATVQNQMPMLGAGPARKPVQPPTQTHSRTGSRASSSSSSAADAGTATNVKGNRVRGNKRLVSEKAKVVHQLQPVRRPSGGATGTGAVTAASNGNRSWETGSKDVSEQYDAAQEKEAVRQLEEVLLKEAQSKTSYLRESFEDDRASAKIIEYDLKLDESISRQQINLSTDSQAELDDSTDAKGGHFFYTEVDTKAIRNGPLKSDAKTGSKAADDTAAAIVEDESGENAYDDDFEVDDDEVEELEEEDGIEYTDEEAAYIDIMQPDSVSPQERRRRGSSLDDDGFTNYSSEDLKRNIEDLVDLVNVSRERAINAMGMSLFSRVYDTCLDSMDLNRNVFQEEAMEPSSPFIIKLEEILYEKMPERNIEEVLSVVFSVKVLIAMENRLRSLQDIEGKPL